MEGYLVMEGVNGRANRRPQNARLLAAEKEVLVLAHLQLFVPPQLSQHLRLSQEEPGCWLGKNFR